MLTIRSRRSHFAARLNSGVRLLVVAAVELRNLNVQSVAFVNSIDNGFVLLVDFLIQGCNLFAQVCNCRRGLLAIPFVQQ